MVKIKKLPGNWELRSPFAEEAVPAFRSLDGLKGSDAFIAGTNKNEIYLLREGGEATVRLATLNPHSLVGSLAYGRSSS